MPAPKPAQEVEFEVLGKDAPKPGAEMDPLIALIAKLMDSIFVIPGTKIRFGLDPLIGLIPALGTTASSLVSVVLIAMSARRGVPNLVLARMAVNVLVNAALDAVPGVGDGLSIFFRSNARNYELLQKHAGTRRPATMGDKVFLVGLIAAVLLVIGMFIVGTVTVVHAIWSHLSPSA